MQGALLGMTNADWMLLLAAVVQALWVFAFGACVGSLLNVLVYRLPLGLDVVTPSSRCPSCETKLTWRENVPIFGWLALRGRCRFCRSPISAEYPIVEAACATLWVLVWLVLYTGVGERLGVQPEWARGGFRETWPTFAVVVCLFSCLIAVLLIDARTFHIPMSLLIVPAAFALVVHPLHAAWLQRSISGGLVGHAPDWEWSIATPGPRGWWWIGAAMGGMVGLVIANILLAKGWIRRSFADYDEWLKSQGTSAVPAEGGEAATADAPADSPEQWTLYPHARREMLRELIFLAPCIGLGLLGAAIAAKFAGPWRWDSIAMASIPAREAPLWLGVLAGVLMGVLIGGGVVWAMRIFGSLAFGKEALGLGDVHLMAAVGACLGWIDAVLGFFGAAFVGVAWAVLGKMLGGPLKRHMPFGPYLAIATVLVWFGKPGVEWLIGLVARTPVHLP